VARGGLHAVDGLPITSPERLSPLGGGDMLSGRNVMKRGVTRRPEISEDDRGTMLIAATALAMAGGVLRPCVDHPEVLLLVPGGDIRDAFLFGKRVFSEKPVKTIFRSQRQMVHSIKAAVGQHALTTCPVCEPPKSD
jgi:hypothetical protein